jgi:hypothetical protein
MASESVAVEGSAVSVPPANISPVRPGGLQAGTRDLSGQRMDRSWASLRGHGLRKELSLANTAARVNVAREQSYFTTRIAMNAQQYDESQIVQGFIAALDQSGGSTPKALSLYGIKPEDYSGDQQMFDLMHAMRARIVNSPGFNGDRVLAAILFEQTMDREIGGRGTADYLWSVKRVVPFVKVDKGLADEATASS